MAKNEESADHSAEHIADHIADACTICLDVLNTNKYTLICNHSFHTKCITEWFEKSRTCPMCRRVIKIEEARQYVRDRILDPIHLKQLFILLAAGLENLHESLHGVRDVISESLESPEMQTLLEEAADSMSNYIHQNSFSCMLI